MYDVIIIGAGAAGMMAAGAAAKNGNKVLLLEKMEKSGRKVRITGKGRCNVTNTKSREEFLSKIRVNREFFTPSFEHFDNEATISFFKEEGVRLEFERGGRVFPESGKAWDIANALEDFAKDSGAEIQLHTTVTGLRTIGGRVNGVKVRTRKGFERTLECKNVIICTGGVSYPATGSTGDGYEFAYDLGHEIEEVRPSLVPLVSHSPLAKKLSGIKLKNVAIKLLVDGETAGEEFGEMEFGTRGIEGAVILRLSRTAVDAFIDGHEVAISIDMKSALTEEVLVARIERELEDVEDVDTAGELFRKLLPKPMVSPFADEVGIRLDTPSSRLTDTDKQNIISKLKDLRIKIDDYGTFEEAVVTAGGVDVSNVDPHTLQSKLVNGLYFAGEVLDIDADTGGYNLQIAFSTGHLAGQLRKGTEDN